MKNFDSINKNNRPPQVYISKDPVKAEDLSLLQRPKKTGRRWIKKTLGLIAVVVLILGTVVVSRAVNLSSKIFVGKKTTFFEKIRAVFTGGSSVRLQGEDQGQINILILGIGGEGHDGPYLTDTMLLAQIRPDTGQVSLTSIPRDYWVQMPESDSYAKINQAFSNGYLKNHDWDEAGSYARQVVEKISGLTIPYFAVVDFAGFEKAINTVGGVDITIDDTFTDYSYPNDATNGYLPPVTFTQGTEHMDGTRALIFARSRHAAGPEGSDFARSKRQQKVIQAFKEKVLKLNLVTDIGKINSLLGIFADHFHTNLSPEEILHIYSLEKSKGIQSLISVSLDPSTSIICPFVKPDSGAYTLVPCPGKTETDVENFFKNTFALGQLYQEKAVIWMSNSGSDKTIYQNANQKLSEAGLTVWEVPFGSGQPLSQNVFYQVNPKPATAEFLKNTLGATEMTLPPPGFNIDSKKVDVIVILGKQ